MNELVAGAGELLAAIPEAGFDTPVRTLPLSAVAEAWEDGADDYRLVLRA
jgi:hypothetical protein